MGAESMESIIQQVVLYIIFSIGLFVILLFFLNLLEQFFTALFSDFSQNDTLEKESLIQRLNFLKHAQWRKEQHIEALEKDYDQRENLFFHEIDQLIEKNRQYEQEIMLLKNTEESTVKTVVVAENTAAPYTANHFLKNFVEEVYDQVFCGTIEEEQQLYRNSIQEFDAFLQREKIRCALPYKVILRLYHLYDDDQMKAFAQSFEAFYDNFRTLEIKQIYQSSYLSPEQKLKQLQEKELIDVANEEFVKFVFYMLTHFSYRQVNALYQNFMRVYDVHFYTGTIKIEVTSKEAQQLFEEQWLPEHKNYQTEYIIHPQMVGGIIIHYANMSIDMSYKEMMQRYVMKKEV